ncbi:MAG: nucleotidyltransferase domain-containing protein [Candidatus Methanofastidiosia archaeon]
MKEKIYQICKNVESEKGITILFAVENGSRAWGFSSKDSDYDVRFVFVRPLKEYLQIKNPPNVINFSLDKHGQPCDAKNALIDITGFDIFKYVKLLSKSNPTCIEWLISDIVYYGKQNKVFTDFALKNFSKIALYHHYKSMCRNNYEKFILSKKHITYKKYLYALRGLINAKWVVYNQSIPPFIFEDVLKEMKEILPEYITDIVYKIIQKKKKGKEKEHITNIEIVDKFIEHFLQNDKESPQEKSYPSIDVLNKEIQRIILSQ